MSALLPARRQRTASAPDACCDSEEGGKCVSGKQPCPQKQRAFLSGPESGKFVVKRQRAIAMRRHIRHGKIIGEEIVLEAADRDGDQNTNCQSGVPSALRQQSL